ncbi:hypothetical protein [Streptomyces sp. NPDC057002]|uniref:hypothetical protein n=1 Tax=Streptomyces sp. NPDC057002 TaxID=3345992 RepID=UPI00363E83F9
MEPELDDFFDLAALNPDRLAKRSIDQLADSFAELKAIKHPETAARYRAEIGFFFQFMRRFGADPTVCSQPHVMRYMTWLAQETHPDHRGECWHECRHLPYGAASRAHRLAALSGFYNYAIANGLDLAANPCLDIPIVVPGTAAVDHLTEWQAHQFWDGARDHSHRSGALVGLLLGCGLRKEEVRRARVENLGENDYGPTLRFWRVKRKKEQSWQTINLPQPTAQAVMKCVGDRTRGPILMSPRWTVAEDGEREKAHLTDAGIDDILHRIAAHARVREDSMYAHLSRKTSISFSRTLPGLALETTMTFYGHLTLKDHMRYDAFAYETFKDPIYNPAQGSRQQVRDFWRLAA